MLRPVRRQGLRRFRDPDVVTPAEPVRHLTAADQPADDLVEASRRAGTSDRRRSSRPPRRRARCGSAPRRRSARPRARRRRRRSPASRTRRARARSRARAVIVSRRCSVGSARQPAVDARGVEPAQQHLAVAGGVQRDVLADPVVRLQRRRAGDLVEVERGASESTAMLTVSPVSAASCRQTAGPPGRGRAGPWWRRPAGGCRRRAGTCRGRRSARPGGGASSVATSRNAVLLCTPELGGDLGDPGLAGAGQHLEDGQRPVDGLDAGAAGASPRSPLRHEPTLAQQLLRIADAFRRRNDAARPEYDRRCTDGAPTDARRLRPHPLLPRPSRHRARRQPGSWSSTAATSWRASSSATRPRTGSSCGSTSASTAPADARARCARRSRRSPSGSA